MRLDLLLRGISLGLSGALLLSNAALAAPAWKQLSPQQQALITPALQSQGGNFDKLPEARRAALIKGADRWLSMSPAQRNTATQQFQQWQRLSGQEKALVLERRERFRKLSPEQRKALLDTQQQFLKMPLEQQQDLRTEFDALSVDALPAQPSFGAPASPIPSDGTSSLGLPLSPPNTGGANLPLPH